MTRLPQQPGERIDRSTSVGFTFDGKRVEQRERAFDGRERAALLPHRTGHVATTT